MYTECFGPANLEKPARKLQQGGLVAFPTETVYGLGTPILNEGAIQRLYHVKKRPLDRSLPVLISNFSQLQFVATSIPKEVELLAAKFLPGPLTLILKKHPNVSALITAGKGTVAVRIPSNPVARRLVELTGCPLVAPSGNRSGNPSPVQANHVLEDLNGLIDGVVDGGETEYGLESTLLLLKDPNHPVILRKGVITQGEIERVLGCAVQVHPDALLPNSCSLAMDLRSAVRLFSSWEEIKIYLKLSSKSKRMIMSEEPTPFKEERHFPLKETNLYEGLRVADREGCAEVLVLCTPELKRNVQLLSRLKQIACA